MIRPPAPRRLGSLFLGLFTLALPHHGTVWASPAELRLERRTVWEGERFTKHASCGDTRFAVSRPAFDPTSGEMIARTIWVFDGARLKPLTALPPTWEILGCVLEGRYLFVGNEAYGGWVDGMRRGLLSLDTGALSVDPCLAESMVFRDGARYAIRRPRYEGDQACDALTLPDGSRMPLVTTESSERFKTLQVWFTWSEVETVAVSAGDGPLCLHTIHPPASSWMGEGADRLRFVRACHDGDGVALPQEGFELPAWPLSVSSVADSRIAAHVSIDLAMDGLTTITITGPGTRRELDIDLTPLVPPLDRETWPATLYTTGDVLVLAGGLDYRRGGTVAVRHGSAGGVHRSTDRGAGAPRCHARSRAGRLPGDRAPAAGRRARLRPAAGGFPARRASRRRTPLRDT